jgi:acetyl-CoA acetyltransferase/uncharacterized OB-fold protein
MRAAAAIVGVADAASPTGELEGTTRALELAMIREALDDAGLGLADVDGIFAATGGQFMHSMELAEYLGVQPVWTDSTLTGGSSFEVLVEHATAAIALGRCEVAVVVYAATPRSSFRRGGPGFGGGAQRAAALGAVSPLIEWELPYGTRMPMGAYALAANRHQSVYGTTSEQLAAIAVSTRQWATRNPRARLRDPITVEDVLASPVEATPLHKLDCCLVTDGAGAVVLTSAARARDLRRPPVLVLGAASSHTHAMISQMPDLTVTAGAVSGPRAFAMAGLGPADVDVAELYDSFTITVLLALEDLGFCAKGEGGPFVADGRLGPGRRTAGQHQRRRAVLHPPRHVRDLPAGGGHPAAPGGVRRASGARGRGGGRPRLRGRAVGDVDGGAGHGGHAMSAPAEPDQTRFAPPESDAGAPFWEATRARRLVLPWCTACERPHWFPRDACPHCLGDTIVWREASGRGVVHACSTMPKAALPGLVGHVPYVVALVDLAEGVRVMTNVVGCPADEVHVGQAVAATWEALEDGRHLLVFEPRTDA